MDIPISSDNLKTLNVVAVKTKASQQVSIPSSLAMASNADKWALAMRNWVTTSLQILR